MRRRGEQKLSRRKLARLTFQATRRLHVALRSEQRLFRRHGIPNPQWLVSPGDLHSWLTAHTRGLHQVNLNRRAGGERPTS